MKVAVKNISRVSVRLAVMCALLAGSQPVLAQDDGSEVSSRDLAISGESQIPGGFALEDVSSGEAERQLRAKELELMKQLANGQGDAAEPVPDRAAEREANIGASRDNSVEEVSFENAPSRRPANDHGRRGLVAGAHDEISNEANALQDELSEEVRKQKALLSDLKSNNSNLKQKLTASEQKAQALKKQLDEAHNRLLLAETEVERLSRLIDTRKGKTYPQFSKASGTSQGGAVEGAPAVRAAAAAPADDVLVGTVVVDKANLRTGPGKNHSTVMSVPKNTTLVVETREGEWYRVVTPHGTRAWAAAEILRFGAKGDSAPTRTVKVKGYDAQDEEQALNFIRSANK